MDTEIENRITYQNVLEKVVYNQVGELNRGIKLIVVHPTFKLNLVKEVDQHLAMEITTNSYKGIRFITSINIQEDEIIAI